MIYVFGGYELDMECYELRLEGEPLRVEPKVFDLLAYLIQHHGQFVSKEDLYTHLWPNQFVSESALTYCMTAARKAVGDDGRVQRLIKTVYGRGYRFIAPVQERLRGGADEDAPLVPLAEEQFPGTTGTALPAHTVQTEPPLSLPPGEARAGRPLPPGLRTLEAERRQLTVMWCRVVTAPVLSEHLDPEELHEVMQDVHNVCVEVFRRFEGYTAQHFGDGLLVYFGYPHAHEDDAHRAVRTALEMVRVLGRFNVGLDRERGVKLTVRVGIHTGIVVVGEVGSDDRREQLALGNTPHIAAQLSGLAAPNTVVISPATLKLVEGYFVCQALGSHILEDLPQPLAVYQVLQESATQSRIAVAAATGLTPFVGREQEIELLRERWEQVKDGAGQVVWLSGEAGIGKSRLVQVHYEHLAGEAYLRFESRCSPYYQNSALFPIVEHVQQRLQWSRADTPQAKLSKLESTLKPYGFVLEEVVPLFAALLSLGLPARYPPPGLTPQQQKQKTFEVILAWLLKEAEQQPVSFVMEDFHWADPSTLELLTLLIDQVPTVRILVLLTFRSDFRPPWAMRSHVTHITLKRLTRRQIEQIIQNVARGKTLPAEVLQQLVAKSDGVPLFVEEMTRMVLESGLIKERDGQYELVGPLSPLAIPATLHDSLMARLDRLGVGKQVAQLGATVGKAFSYELLQAVAPLDAATLQQGLARLVDAELLYQRGFPPQAGYTFKHALVQEAAYESLLRSTRQRYHRQIAQVLEERFPETCESQPELLAHHYTAAGLRRQAIPYWQQAGQRAMARSAHLEAIAHFRQALALNLSLPDAPARLRCELVLQMALGVALMSTKGYADPEVERTYVRARELCQQVGDAAQLFAVLHGLWLVHLVRGELQMAYELGEQLLRLAQRTHDTTLLMEAHRALGASLFLRGELTPAGTHLEQGSRLYNVERHRALATHYGQDSGVVCLGYAAWTLWLRGYPDQALRTIHAALTLAQQLAHPYSLGFALTFAAWLQQWRREPQAVLQHAAASMTLAHEHGFPLLLALGLTLQGWASVAQDQGAEGIAQVRQGLAAQRATGAAVSRPYLLALLAEALATKGRIEEGLSTLAEALALVEKSGERWWQAELYRLQGELLLQRARPDVSEAEAALQHALDVARRQQARSLELRITMSLSRLWQGQGKPDRAWRVLEAIYGWFTEGFDTPDLTEAKALLETLRAAATLTRSACNGNLPRTD
jgi:TOMM system kinase/cyclase fusion protein